ncbi:MAG TPA: MIP/aquaporin family protein [Ktedonobacteraceae bacterium]|nr:MIP/aquaporin family protein [Ktedonobacteraceae bacterium]
MFTPVMLRRYLAEFLGTFAYVFFGCGAKIVVGNQTSTTDLLFIYLTFGLTIFAMGFAVSHISAAPFNPAITLGLAVARRFPWRYVLPYCVAQILGAVAASGMHLLLIPQLARQAQFGATIPTIAPVPAVAIEAIITFFLMLVFMSSATDRRITRATTGLAVGATITLGGLFAALLTGGSMNPARSLAPALLAGGSALSIVWVYWIGPLLGAILGALAYELMRGGKEYAMSIPEGIFDKIGRARGSTGMLPQSSSGPQSEEQMEQQLESPNTKM